MAEMVLKFRDGEGAGDVVIEVGTDEDITTKSYDDLTTALKLGVLVLKHIKDNAKSWDTIGLNISAVTAND